MKHLTFEEWLKRNPDLLEGKEDQEITCTVCDGEGEKECECLDCGHIHTAECDECLGSGKIHGDKALREMYKARLKEDQALVRNASIVQSD